MTDVHKMRKNMVKKIVISFISSLLIGVLGLKVLIFLTSIRFLDHLRTGTFRISIIFILFCSFLVALYIEKKLLGRFFATIFIFTFSALIFFIGFFLAWSYVMEDF